MGNRRYRHETASRDVESSILLVEQLGLALGKTPKRPQRPHFARAGQHSFLLFELALHAGGHHPCDVWIAAYPAKGQVETLRNGLAFRMLELACAAIEGDEDYSGENSLDVRRKVKQLKGSSEFTVSRLPRERTGEGADDAVDGFEESQPTASPSPSKPIVVFFVTSFPANDSLLTRKRRPAESSQKPTGAARRVHERKTTILDF